MGTSRKSVASPSLRPGNSVDKIRRYLERRIIEGKLEPRERIIEQDICRQVKLSRSPVREALRLLAADGLVEIHARRGAQVADITWREVQDVFQVFEELEVLATRLAARHMTRDALRQTADLLKPMSQAAATRDVRSYFRYNALLHGLLYRSSGNEKLAQILLNLGKQITRFRYAALAAPGRMAGSLREHRALMAALGDRDEKTATELVRASVANARRALGARMGFKPDLLRD